MEGYVYEDIYNSLPLHKPIAKPEAKPKENKLFAADKLVEIDQDPVQQINYHIIRDSYESVMRALIVKLGVNRNEGFVRINMKEVKKKKHRVIGIFIRKKSIYVVAIHDGIHVYELGSSTDKRKYFKGEFFTEFGGRYVDLFGDDKFYAVELGRTVLRRSFDTIVNNIGDCEKWKYSAGVFALTFSEPARFLWILDLLISRMDSGQTVKLNDFKWVSRLTQHWGTITKTAAAWEAEPDDTSPQLVTHSLPAAKLLETVGRFAWDGLIFLYVDCDGDGGGRYGGGVGDAGEDGSRGGGYKTVAAIGYIDSVSTRLGNVDHVIKGNRRQR